MHLGIDIREACDEQRTGKGRWTLGFLRELLLRKNELTLFTNADLPEHMRSLLINNERFHLVKIPAKGFAWHCTVARMLLEESHIDAYISTTSYIVCFLLGRRKKVVPIIHDLIAFRSEPHDRKATLIERCTLGRTVATAEFLCAVSDATKHDLLSRYSNLDPDHIETIFAGPGSEPVVRHPDQSGVILSIGTFSPRKNQRRLIQAYAALPANLRDRATLVLVGKRGWKDDSVITLITKTPGVLWKEYLPDVDCQNLLGRATIYAFPSLYEGFGLSVLDAMQSGIAVLTSDRGSLQELVGDTALLINPEDVSSMKNGLQTLLTDESLRVALSAKAKARASLFTWKRTVDLFLARMETVV